MSATRRGRYSRATPTMGSQISTQAEDGERHAAQRMITPAPGIGWDRRLSVPVVAFVAACSGTLPPGQDGPFPFPDEEVVAANEALGDPYRGRFPFDDAVAGLPPSGRLTATLVTDEGDVECVLDPGHAPLTVASFVGLARGLRPFRDEDGTWQRKPYYRDLEWHRAEPGLFVQTGRRGRLAEGGFFLQDEISPGDTFARGGVLAMANAGGEHSGSVQFFVTTGPAPHLEGHHTIFGQCDEEAVLRRIEGRIGRGERPRLKDVVIRRDSG